ncbi:SID1 transmembrane family member 1-like [Halichondria panicea]|uniref:SID1 transmembrane family member 1-like n=1 Tax=Halichondria panicea TaxID=6063 RepID=UPI00312B4CED
MNRVSSWLLCLLGSWLAITSGQKENATLSTISINPCSGVIYENVSLYKSDIYTVVNNVSLCGDNWNPNTTNGFRVYTYAESDGNNLTHTPVVFVVRQDEDGIISWTIPLLPLGFSTLFYQVNRTVCPISPQQPGNLPLLYVDVFSSSPTPVNYTISIEAVKDFEIKVAPVGQEPEYTKLVTGATAPQILYVRFPNDSDVLTVQAWTDDFKCAYISIQNKSCPVNDLLTTAQSRGIFQTMSTSAFLTVRASEVNDREFLIVIITTTFSVCHSKYYVQQTPLSILNSTDQFEQVLAVQVKRLPPTSTFALAIALPVIIFAVVWIIGLLVPFFCCPQLHWIPVCGCARAKQQDQLLSDVTSKATYSTIEKSALQRKDRDILDGPDPDSDGSRGQRTKLYDESLEMSANVEADESKLKLPRMSKQKYKKMNDLYSVYGWNTFTVGIFYALPAFQLVFSEQRLLNSSGNQDQCYYNFKCAYPVGVLSAFNNIWSNIGYVMLGALFLVIVTIRKFLYKRQREKDIEFVDTHGVPQYFGIYYAMGIALIIEGVMSAFYHICPTNANFQFDTAFMFIIGGLFLVKVFQNRHPDIHTNAFLAFFSFAVLIFFTLFGLYFDRDNPVVVRLIMFLLVLGFIFLLFISFYHFHQLSLKMSVLIQVLKNIKSYFTTCPRHKGRFFKLLFGFGLNIFLVIMVIALHTLVDIASSVVLFFFTNLFYFIAVYTFQKVWYKESITILPICLPLLIGALWGTAFWFFFHHVSDWGLSPAESREYNKECILLGFYDNHDVWHFLSATAMFFSFLFVLVLDDGVANVEREELHIF